MTGGVSAGSSYGSGGSNINGNASGNFSIGANGDDRLYCRFNDMDGFYASLANPRSYEAAGFIKAGVVPHHLTAARLISGFFKLCAASPDSYDTIVIVAPNHAGGVADFVYSRRDWDIFGGVLCDVDFTGALGRISINGASVAENDACVERDHSVSALVPYIGHYLPGVKIVPILVNSSVSENTTAAFASELFNIIDASGKRTLLVCSVDFSHFCDMQKAARNDQLTEEAIAERNYRLIHKLNDKYLDSPASLAIFLRYLDYLGAAAEIVDHTDASEFIGSGVAETTSYFVMTGAWMF